MATNNSSDIPTGAANTVLQGQGAGTALAFSTATYPATTTINQVLYSSSANVVGGITTGNNGVLITSSGGAPSISSTLPSAVQTNITAVGNLGNQTNTTRVVFSAVLSATDSNVTGDGTTYTLGSGNVLTVTQQGSSMATNGTFTAPVTGYYLFNVNVSCVGNASATDGLAQIIANGATYNLVRNLPKDTNATSYNGSAIVTMAATSTATVTLTISGVTKSVNVTGGAGNPTSFMGFLLC